MSTQSHIVATSCQLVVSAKARKLAACGYALLALLVGPLFSEELSFELDEKESAKPEDRTYTVTAASELATLGITGHGARNVVKAVQEALKGKPEGTKARVSIGVGTEGSVRWTYFYPRSVVTLDNQGRPDGVEFLAVNLVMTVGRIVVHRLIPWKNGIKQGLEKEYAGKRLRAEVPWVKGKMHGPQKTFFRNGKVRSETVYVNGIANGPTRLWDENGSLTSEGDMKDGKLDGRFVEYWPGTEQPKRTIHYRMGVTHGPVTDFYRSGKLKRKRAFKNEAAHGEDLLYNEDGTIAQTRYWLEGDPVTKEEFEKRSKE